MAVGVGVGIGLRQGLQGSAWSPADLSPLVWLKNSDIANDTWVNSGSLGAGANMAQSTPGLRPSVEVTGGITQLRGNGITRYMEHAFDPSGRTELTLTAWVYMDSTQASKFIYGSTNTKFFALGTAASGQQYRPYAWWYRNSPAGNVDVYGPNGWDPPVTGGYVLTVRMQNGDFAVHEDNVAGTASTSSPWDLPTGMTTSQYLFARNISNAPAGFFGGAVRELAIYPSALLDEQLTLQQTYYEAL